MRGTVAASISAIIQIGRLLAYSSSNPIDWSWMPRVLLLPQNLCAFSATSFIGD